jgi:formiminotetrahydrofolate cyclodeaminase
VPISLDDLLNHTAKRGTWYGGGSAAALACALAAALLEKLCRTPRQARAIRAVRLRATKLIEGDARAFAEVIRAQAGGNRRAAARKLRAATKIPATVYRSAHELLALSQPIARMINPKYQSDLRCARAIAQAAAESAKALITTNLDWLGDAEYSRQMRKQLAGRA